MRILGAQTQKPKKAETVWIGQRSQPRFSLYVKVLLGLILGGAFFIRVYHLNLNNFWNDELLHAGSAQALIKKGIPELPSGRLYHRALPFTYIVALFFRLFGVSEVTARLPSVLFGTLSVAAVFFAVKRWFGVRAALLASALIAFDPLSVRWSRECRMYAMFQFTYLVMSYCTIQCLELETKARRKWLWGIGAFFFLALSYSLQSLTVVFFPALAVFFFLMIAVRFAGTYEINAKKYAFLLGLGLAVLAGLYFEKSGFLMKSFQLMNTIPVWALHDSHAFFYKWMIEDTYPFFFWVYPAAIIFLCMRNMIRGLYAACLFTVPFLFHSFVFDWKEDRYMIYAFPFFFIGIAPFLIFCYEFMKGHLAAFAFTSRYRILIPVWGAALLFIVVGITQPWLSETWQLTKEKHHPSWRETLGKIKPELEEGDIVVASEAAALKFYGLKNPLYKINNYDENLQDPKPASGFYTDDYAGARIIRDKTELSEILVKYPQKAVWFLISDNVFSNPEAMPADIKKLLMESADWHGTRTQGQSTYLPTDEKNVIFVAKIKQYIKV